MWWFIFTNTVKTCVGLVQKCILQCIDTVHLITEEMGFVVNKYLIIWNSDEKRRTVLKLILVRTNVKLVKSSWTCMWRYWQTTHLEINTHLHPVQVYLNRAVLSFARNVILIVRWWKPIWSNFRSEIILIPHFTDLTHWFRSGFIIFSLFDRNTVCFLLQVIIHKDKNWIYTVYVQVFFLRSCECWIFCCVHMQWECFLQGQ